MSYHIVRTRTSFVVHRHGIDNTMTPSPPPQGSSPKHTHKRQEGIHTVLAPHHTTTHNNGEADKNLPTPLAPRPTQQQNHVRSSGDVHIIRYIYIYIWATQLQRPTKQCGSTRQAINHGAAQHVASICCLPRIHIYGV